MLKVAIYESKGFAVRGGTPLYICKFAIPMYLHHHRPDGLLAMLLKRNSLLVLICLYVQYSILYTSCAFKSALEHAHLLQNEALLAPSILYFLATACSSTHSALRAAIASLLAGGGGGNTYPAIQMQALLTQPACKT